MQERLPDAALEVGKLVPVHPLVNQPVKDVPVCQRLPLVAADLVKWAKAPVANVRLLGRRWKELLVELLRRTQLQPFACAVQ